MKIRKGQKQMKWTLDPSTGGLNYRENNGAYGYTVMVYKDKYALYFHNAWRNDRPLGEYLTKEARGSSVFAEPISGLSDDLLFESITEAQKVASIHKNNDIEPAGSQLQDDEEWEKRNAELEAHFSNHFC